MLLEQRSKRIARDGVFTCIAVGSLGCTPQAHVSSGAARREPFKGQESVPSNAALPGTEGSGRAHAAQESSTDAAPGTADANPVPRPTEASELLGRLAIEVNGSIVSVDHVVYSLDQLRFVVSSSRDGWVFVYHAGERDRPALLWPPPGNGDAANWIARDQTRAFPNDGTIEIDETVELERFYVAIVADPHSPAPPIDSSASTSGLMASSTALIKRSTAATKQSERATAAIPEQEIGNNDVVQIRVRGGVGVRLRGVRYKPSGNGSFIGFHAVPGDDRTVAALEFRLHHVRR